MVTETIKINGMHCDACEKTITRALAKSNINVEEISFSKGTATITADTIKRSELAKILKNKGYSLNNDKEQKQNNTNATKCSTEKSIIFKGSIILAITLLIQIILTYTVFSKFYMYKSEYTLPLILIPVVVVTNLVAIWHQRAYKTHTSCMTGMMVGMTIGMMTGFGIGAIAGLLNGMFWGSLVGTAMGIIAGVYSGKCCGTMGIMEGMMAGIMAGTMGAMLTVMMILDHPLAFLVILVALCTVLLGFMMRMTYEEHKGTDVESKPWPAYIVFLIAISVTLLLSIIMLILPKGLY